MVRALPSVGLQLSYSYPKSLERRGFKDLVSWNLRHGVEYLGSRAPLN